MSKPLLEPTRWATLGTNNTAPSSGQRDSGWTNNQLAISSYFNSLAKAYYDWFAWIDSGAWDATDLTLSGNLVVQGNTTLGDAAGDTITINGTTTFATSPILGNNKLKFNNRVISITLTNHDCVATSSGTPGNAAGNSVLTMASPFDGYFRLPSAPPGQAGNSARLKSITLKGSIGGGAGTATLYSYDTDLGSAYSSVVSAVTIGASTALTIASPSGNFLNYVVRIAVSLGTYNLYGVDMMWDSV